MSLSISFSLLSLSFSLCLSPYLSPFVSLYPSPFVSLYIFLPLSLSISFSLCHSLSLSPFVSLYLYLPLSTLSPIHPFSLKTSPLQSIYFSLLLFHSPNRNTFSLLDMTKTPFRVSKLPIAFFIFFFLSCLYLFNCCFILDFYHLCHFYLLLFSFLFDYSKIFVNKDAQCTCTLFKINIKKCIEGMYNFENCWLGPRFGVVRSYSEG